PQMMTPPSVGYYPMMNQQAMMAQNAMLAQQMMLQQQALMQVAYNSNSAMPNPYMPQTTMMNQASPLNFARNYTGPQPPNPFGANAVPQDVMVTGNAQQPIANPQYAIAAQVEQ